MLNIISLAKEIQSTGLTLMIYALMISFNVIKPTPNLFFFVGMILVLLSIVIRVIVYSPD